MNDDNFYSINRLVEFGMSMAVAQQMVKSMNHAIVDMHVAGAMSPIQTSAPKIYYAMIDGRSLGPLTEQELSRLIVDGKVVKETYVWKPGMLKWDIVENVADVLRLVALAPPPFVIEK